VKKRERVMKLGKMMRKSHSTSDNSSHPLSGFLRQNEILFHKKYFSTFDKLVVTNPAQTSGCKTLLVMLKMKNMKNNALLEYTEKWDECHKKLLQHIQDIYQLQNEISKVNDQKIKKLLIDKLK